MTKLWMSADLLAYQQDMKEALRQVIQQNFIAGVETAELLERPFGGEELLPAPEISSIWLEAYEGKGDDYIAVSVFSDFPIASVLITIRDPGGNLIESCEAEQHPSVPELWDMPANVRVPSGTIVTVQAVVIDCMDGFAVQQVRKTIEHEPG